MEQQVEEVKDKRNEYLKSVVTDPKRMNGVWEIKIDINNSQGTKAFGGRYVTDYIHPLTGINTPLIDLNGQKLLGFHIDKPTKVLYPDTKPMDRRIVDWLISHPEIGVEGVALKDNVAQFKVSNPTITMKNVDRQEMTDIDNEDKIDLIIGRLSDDNPKTGVSLERLRYLLAHFNLPYFDIRYIKNKTTEKKYLRKKIKTFARGINSDGSLNAEKIEDVLNHIDNLKYNYEMKEMLRTGIIRESNGSFKYNNVPLGSTEQSIVNWMRSNAEIYIEMTQALYPILKEQGFSFK